MATTTRPVETRAAGSLCTNCGIPLDAKYFDESGIKDAPGPGEEVLLARVELSPQYCGALEYFSQFTDAWGKDQSQIATPGLQWLLLSNGRPLYPYLQFDRILNPWGFGSFQFSLRLDEGATVEFIVRGVNGAGGAASNVNKVGGRIMGRYWYNPAYGDVERRRF